MKLNVKKGDTVLVLSGKDKGARGKVLSCNPSSRFAQVDGVNIVTKHQKARKQGEAGGIIKDAGNINISNIMVVCPACDQATRVNRAEVEGKNVRICKKCGANIDAKKVVKAKKTKKSEETTAEGEKTEKKKTAKKTPKKAEPEATQAPAEQAQEAKKAPAKKAPAKKAPAKEETAEQAKTEQTQE